MSKFMGVVGLLLLITIVIQTGAIAGVNKGQRLYKKKFYKKCGFSGVVFARNHLQTEWEDIYVSGQLPQEAKKICPNLVTDTLNEKEWNEIYVYSVKYAKDGVPPNGCND